MNSFLIGLTLVVDSWFLHYQDAIEYHGPYAIDTCLPVPVQAKLFPSNRCSSGISGNLLNYLLKVIRIESKKEPCDILVMALDELYGVQFTCHYLKESNEVRSKTFQLRYQQYHLVISTTKSSLHDQDESGKRVLSLRRLWRKKS